MFLPLVFLITLLSGCAADTNCKFGGPPAREAFISQGLGVNIHFTDPQPGEVKMIAAAGFRWVRVDFKWDATERERSQYDFAKYDRLMSALDQSKIHALFILDYGNPLYDNGAPPRTAHVLAHRAPRAGRGEAVSGGMPRRRIVPLPEKE